MVATYFHKMLVIHPHTKYQLRAQLETRQNKQNIEIASAARALLSGGANSRKLIGSREMELAVQSILSSRTTLAGCTSTSSLSPPIFHFSKASRLPHHHNSVPINSSKCFYTQLQGFRIKASNWKRNQRRSLGAIRASDAAESTTTASADVVSERWLLEPVGDGDSRHIGYKVDMPGAFEIASSDLTVGRLPDKADIVIPVATVSGVHARIQKKGGNLLVTDLDSTNGTFIDERRLRPRVATTVSSGSSIIFGDMHLAMFRVSKLENVQPTASAPEESEDKAEADSPTAE